jgi:(R,R)-butanediol dehydrogenase / meso-butanediol dehydrogenase / diacetyl reductase
VAPDVLPLEQVVEAGIRPLAEGTSARVKTLIDPQAREPRRHEAR